MARNVVGSIKVPGYRGLPDLPSLSALPHDVPYLAPSAHPGILPRIDVPNLILHSLAAQRENAQQQQQTSLQLATAMPGMLDAASGNPLVGNAFASAVQPMNAGFAEALRAPQAPIANPYGDVKLPALAGVPDVPKSASDAKPFDWVARKKQYAMDAWDKLEPYHRKLSQRGELMNLVEKHADEQLARDPEYLAFRTRQEAAARLSAETDPANVQARARAAGISADAATKARLGAEDAHYAKNGPAILKRKQDEARAAAAGQREGAPLAPKDDSGHAKAYADEIGKVIAERDRAANSKGAPATVRGWLKMTQEDKRTWAEGEVQSRGMKRPGAGAQADADKTILDALRRLR